MKIELNTDFSVPIWRFYYSHVPYKIPYSFSYNGVNYNNRICIIQIAWYPWFENPTYMDENEILNNYGENHIICVPNQEILNLFNKYRPNLNICLANQNAFIDETLFSIDYSQEIHYNLFVNSQFCWFKNLNLLHDIDNMCGAGYYPCGLTDSDTAKCVKFPYSVKNILNFNNNEERIQKNWKHVEPTKIIKTINSSKIGGIFSTGEGACFSSSEYLLCGIPVLSCKCRGGREIWYDDNNSELCDPNNISIRETLDKMLIKYDNGEYNRETIRNNHIKIMEIYRNNLSHAVLDIMKKIVNQDNLPSLEELTESLKHYHTNNRCYEYTPSYKRQTNRELTALKLLKLM